MVATGEKIVKHSGEGLAEMAAWLMAMTGAAEPSEIHAAIEVPHGPVVEALIERGFQVHAINPKQMDRFRDRFTLAGRRRGCRSASEGHGEAGNRHSQNPLALAPKRSSVQHYPDLANEQDGPSCCLQAISERATRYGAHQSCAVGRITMLPMSTSLGCSMA
jgi:hypothetical protein